MNNEYRICTDLPVYQKSNFKNSFLNKNSNNLLCSQAFFDGNSCKFHKTNEHFLKIVLGQLPKFKKKIGVLRILSK